MLIENIASIEAIIFAGVDIEVNMTYLIMSQTRSESLPGATDLCKCNHSELFHIDEEGHGVCRYCTCEEYDPR